MLTSVLSASLDVHSSCGKPAGPCHTSLSLSPGTMGSSSLAAWGVLQFHWQFARQCLMGEEQARWFWVLLAE